MIDFAAILNLVATGQISLDDAVARLNWQVYQPQGNTCQTCLFWRRGLCTPPGRPEHVEHELSQACFAYEPKPLYADALPYDPPKPKSKIFK